MPDQSRFGCRNASGSQPLSHAGGEHDVALRLKDAERRGRMVGGFLRLSRERERLGEVRVRERAPEAEVDAVCELDGPPTHGLGLREPVLVGQQPPFGELYEHEVDEIVIIGDPARLVDRLACGGELPLAHENHRKLRCDGGGIRVLAELLETRQSRRGGFARLSANPPL